MKKKEVAMWLVGALAFILLVAAMSGCTPKKTVVVPLDNPTPVKTEMASIYTANHSIADSGKKVTVEAQKIVPVAPESAKVITAEAVNILTKSAAVDVAATQATLKDADNAKINVQKDKIIENLQSEISAREADITRLNSNVFTWIIRAAFILGLLAFAGAGAVFIYVKDIKAAATIAVGGMCAILAAISANKMIQWDGPITGVILTGVGAIFCYGVWLVLFNMKRKAAQIVETANAFAKLPTSDVVGMQTAAKQIQDVDTQVLVKSIKKDLSLKSLSAIVP